MVRSLVISFGLFLNIVSFRAYGGCLEQNLQVLSKDTADSIRNGIELSGSLSGVIKEKAGKNSDFIFSKLDELSTEELKIFKEEVQSSSWKWNCD